MTLNYHDSVKQYYGQELKGSADLKTSCFTDAVPPLALRRIIEQIPQEVLSRFYGCGSPVPFGIKGKSLLDLGCGTGRDCYAAAIIVGNEGSVTGLDMLDELIDVARRNIDGFLTKLNISPKVQFITGYIENLTEAGIPEGSQDVVTSNCVINLCPDKEAVLREVYRCLKEGGEFHFSDLYCDRRMPDSVRNDRMLVGEGMGGAMYMNDFLATCRKCRFHDPRIVNHTRIRVSREIEEKVGGATFVSVTFRLFKGLTADPSPELYGQSATYLGSIEGSEECYAFDKLVQLPKGVPTLIDGNTAEFLARSWLAPHFKVDLTKKDHLGPAPAVDPMSVFSGAGEAGKGGGCCVGQGPAAVSCCVPIGGKAC